MNFVVDDDDRGGVRETESADEDTTGLSTVVVRRPVLRVGHVPVRNGDEKAMAAGRPDSETNTKRTVTTNATTAAIAREGASLLPPRLELVRSECMILVAISKQLDLQIQDCQTKA